MEIKDRNFLGLSQLSEEFSFQALLAKLSAHRRSPGVSAALTAECRARMSAQAALPARLDRADVTAPSEATGADVAQFPPLFEEFRARRFNLLWRAAATVSPLWNSTAAATAARTL
jgi:hypothetical protein